MERLGAELAAWSGVSGVGDDVKLACVPEEFSQR